MTDREQVRRLLNPRHVAFVGGRSLAPAIRNCQALGFTGDIWAVNPHHDEIAGHPCVASVDDLPAAPDAAFIGVGADATVEVVGRLARCGAGGCVCLASGFAEVGGEGRDRQAALAAAAGGLAVMGPNCYGLLNYADRVALWPDLHGGTPVAAGAALVAQSGNLGLNATMADRSVPLTHVLSIGNQAVTGFGDWLDGLLDDRRVRAIGLYVEGIPDLGRFRAAARRALAQDVPVVALTAGASDAAGRVVAAHTGSGGGGAATYGRLFEDLGIVRVPTPSALLETLKLFATWDGGGGPSLAVVAASGGDLAVLADLAAPTGLVLPPFTRDGTAALRARLGDLVTVANPLDYGTAVWGRHDELVDCFATVMAQDVDAVVLVLDHPRPATGPADEWEAVVDAFLDAHAGAGGRAAVVSTLPEGLPAPVRQRLLAGGVVPLQGVADAVTALAAAADHRSRRERLLAEADA